LTLPSASTLSPRPSISAATERASIGSPSGVPVPCASIIGISPARTPAKASAARSSACCASPFGAVRLALLPSCRTQLPSTSVPAASEGESEGVVPARSDTAVHESLRTYPSARLSKVWQWPRAEVMPACATTALASRSKSMLTPDASEVEHSPRRSACTPPCSAARALEQAVSKETHGPCSPRAKETRPTVTEHVAAVAA